MAHVFCVFAGVEHNGKVHFDILRQGQVIKAMRSKSSNLKMQHFGFKIHVSDADFSRNSNGVTYFDVRCLKMLKNRFEYMISSFFTYLY